MYRQRELVQLIEFSTQKVSADSKEIFMALFLLLIFALVAAGYVMKTGLEKGDRTIYFRSIPPFTTMPK